MTTPETFADKWFPDRYGGGMYAPEAARTRCACAVREATEARDAAFDGLLAAAKKALDSMEQFAKESGADKAGWDFEGSRCDLEDAIAAATPTPTPAHG